MGKTLKSRGSVQFDALTDEEFQDLVKDTLEESEFIETSETTAQNGTDLVLYEVYENE